jgi:hypothetical protein
MISARLGKRRAAWAPQGLDFLAFRARGRGSDSSLFDELFEVYMQGRFDNLDAVTERTVRQQCSLDRLGPEGIMMLLLGRRPRWTAAGVEQQYSRSLTPRELQGQALLATALTNGRRYVNKSKSAQGRAGPVARRVASVVPAKVSRVEAGVETPSDPVRSRVVAEAEEAPCVRGRARLIDALRARPKYMDQRLAELKKEAWRLERPDFVWHGLLQSFSTMQGSRGYAGLILNKGNYAQVTYDALAALDASDRRTRLDAVLRRAGVRMPKRKAGWLATDFELVAEMGGPAAARELALAQVGTQAKIEFMSRFAGIGPKYARNLWMDVYHPDFRQSIAIDDRIKKISEAMGCEFPTYEAHEAFYLEIARAVGLQGWELDRLLYNYRDHFLGRL